MRLYLDPSALAKLVQREPETDALRRYLHRYPDDERVTSVLARTELVRAVWDGGPVAVALARWELDRLHQVPLDARLLGLAATLVPGPSRTLDAIHLASALETGPGLRAVVTYDRRLAAAAEEIGLPVAAPG